MKELAVRHYRSVVDRAAVALAALPAPAGEGWIAVVRKALGMSAAQLARRLGVTRARVSQAERAERDGGVTLKSMRAMAEAMGCRFVYAIVPADGRVETVVAAQARKKAEALVATAGVHMALERQSLSAAHNRAEVERIAGELARGLPSDLWTDR